MRTIRTLVTIFICIASIILHITSIVLIYLITGIFCILYTIFKGYTPFTVIKKYWLYFPFCKIYSYSLSYTQ